MTKASYSISHRYGITSTRMRFFLIFLMLLATSSGQAQRFVPTRCDSAILTPQEYKKCKLDSLFDSSVVAITNYIIFLKSELLPSYRVKRKAILLPAALQKELQLLMKIYDSTVNVKLQGWRSDMDRNQRYVQPKAYIASLLAGEISRFYPDVYAILLNPIHANLRPQSDPAVIKQMEDWVNAIYAKLPDQLKEEVVNLTRKMRREREMYSNRDTLDLFQGAVEEEKRAQYDVINFLLWTK